MELDIHNISGTTVRADLVRRQTDTEKVSKARERQAESTRRARAAFEQSQEEQTRQLSEKDAESYLKDILRMTSLFDRKLKFTLNRDLGTVIVKVVDRETDKVIKEIPPEALQRLHRRMKEAIGLLIDEEI